MSKKIYTESNVTYDVTITNEKTTESMPKKGFKDKIFKAKYAVEAFIISCMISAMTLSASATGGSSSTTTKAGDDMWTEIVGFIGTWIPRLGGAIIVIGLIMFGLGWQRDDADGKSRGIQVTIGGAIVAAVGGMTAIFMA